MKRNAGTVGCFLVLVALAGCGGAAEPADATAPGTVIVRAGPMEDVFLLTGELTAVESISLEAPRTESWRLQIKWLAEDGSEVQAGDRLVDFDNSAIASTLEEKKAALLQRENDLRSLESSLEAQREDKVLALKRAANAEERARLDAEVPVEVRARREWQDKQAVWTAARAALEKARLDLAAFDVTSRADREVQKTVLERARREIERSEEALDALAVKAPKAGIFILGENWNEERKFQVGDQSWPGMTVASIPDLSVMEVTAWLPEVDDDRIHPGMPARCILDTYPERIFGCRVEEVAVVAGRLGFPVRLSIERSDPSIMRPGMSVRAEIVRRTWEGALLLPRGAVRFDGRRATVRHPGNETPVEVALEACGPADCVVASGLAEGDRVEVR